MMHFASPFVFVPLALALSSPAAFAGVTYTEARAPRAYSELASGTDIRFRGKGGGVTADDEGFAAIPIGFSFPFFGTQYTEVGVSSNGLLVFGQDAFKICDFSLRKDCTAGGKIPDQTRNPHNFIAPWWRNLKGGTTGKARYLKAPNKLTIEF